MTPLSRFGLLVVALLAWDPMNLWSSVGGIAGFQPHHIPALPAGAFDSFPWDAQNKLQNAEIKWQGELRGPESLAFDSRCRGPYAGVADGRIVRYDGADLGWTTFAYTSKNRSASCPPSPDAAHENVCGRPLGLRFHKGTGELWIADAYMGIMKVGAEGGQAEVILSDIDNMPMKFPNDLDFDDEGNLYFTDSTTRWQYMNFVIEFLEGTNTGRLIKYNLATKETTVVMNNLFGANGVAVSKDGMFVLVAETRGGRLWRYWLKGEKAGRQEVFAVLPGWPDNVRSNEEGDFWVALPVGRTKLDAFALSRPWVRTLLTRLPFIPIETVFGWFAGKSHSMVLRFGPNGDVKEVLQDEVGYGAFFTTLAQEHDGKLYLGSAVKPHIAVYTLPPLTHVKEVM